MAIRFRRPPQLMSEVRPTHNVRPSIEGHKLPAMNAAATARTEQARDSVTDSEYSSMLSKAASTTDDKDFY